MAVLTQVAEQPLHRALGLTDGELDRIRELLGREPNHFELAVFSLLWSEHCGYKHSALLLKRFPCEGERVLQGPGENAGVLDLGDGEAVAFKVESHNHPSRGRAVPGRGDRRRRDPARHRRDGRAADRAARRAALRRARLRTSTARSPGSAHYGNSRRRPDGRRRGGLRRGVRGQLPRQRDVRRAAPGRARDDARSARTPGHLLVLYGATTGRDGIGGASVLASQELGEDDADKRPSVQIGDPFTGKKLIEVSVELVERGLVESLQDCGAAGLASALAEMARDGAGVDVHLDRVPLREEELEPWEIMISECQERMVAVVRPGLPRGGRGGLRPLGAPLTP